MPSSGSFRAPIIHHDDDPFLLLLLPLLQGGCAINAVMAIDYTGSNGDPRSPGSLHFMNPAAPNEYLQAITSTAEVREMRAATSE